MDKALAEYAELKAQAVDLDPVELYKAQQAIRPAQEKVAEKQLEAALQRKPALGMLLSAKQETSQLLREDTEERQVRQMAERLERAYRTRKRSDFER